MPNCIISIDHYDDQAIRVVDAHHSNHDHPWFMDDIYQPRNNHDHDNHDQIAVSYLGTKVD